MKKTITKKKRFAIEVLKRSTQTAATEAVAHYTIVTEPRSRSVSLARWESAGEWSTMTAPCYPSIQEAISYLPDVGLLCLEIRNSYNFGLHGDYPVADILFSEQAALSMMRKDPEQEMSRYLNVGDHPEEPDEFLCLILDGVSETGVKMVFFVHWDGLDLQQTVELTGEATEVKELASKLAVECSS